jgi:hypothetical protein
LPFADSLFEQYPETVMNVLLLAYEDGTGMMRSAQIRRQAGRRIEWFARSLELDEKNEAKSESRLLRLIWRIASGGARRGVGFSERAADARKLFSFLL